MDLDQTMTQGRTIDWWILDIGDEMRDTLSAGELRAFIQQKRQSLPLGQTIPIWTAQEPK